MICRAVEPRFEEEHGSIPLSRELDAADDCEFRTYLASE
jgi:hypothetical protein